MTEIKYNPTCFFSGAKDNLKMHPMRNDAGDMVGWIFVQNSIEMKGVELDHAYKIPEAAQNAINILKIMNRSGVDQSEPERGL